MLANASSRLLSGAYTTAHEYVEVSFYPVEYDCNDELAASKDDREEDFRPFGAEHTTW